MNLAVFCLSFLPYMGNAYEDTVTIDTPNGKVRGFRKRSLDKRLNVFLGVPFAEAPIADRRFRPPLEKQPWTETLDALRLPNSCVQEKDTTFGSFVGSNMWNAPTALSEDCLYVNIWAPVDAKQLPVMVWLFGGGYWYGSASLQLYDGSILVTAFFIANKLLCYC